MLQDYFILIKKHNYSSTRGRAAHALLFISS